jgi:hypothetical protein
MIHIGQPPLTHFHPPPPLFNLHLFRHPEPRPTRIHSELHAFTDPVSNPWRWLPIVRPPLLHLQRRPRSTSASACWAHDWTSREAARSAPTLPKLFGCCRDTRGQNVRLISFSSRAKLPALPPPFPNSSLVVATLEDKMYV